MSLNPQPDRALDAAVATALMQRRLPARVESLLVFAAALLLYVGLQGEMPYHDAQRFINQVDSGGFVWDIGHILLQPTAMLLHKWTGLTAVSTLKMLSSTCTAAAIGLFHLLLLRLNMPRWQALLGTIILAGCCSVLTLAPSAHPKLVAFPFVNAALLCLCKAERRGMRNAKPVILAGALLAIGAGYLASVLATVPFAALAVTLVARRDKASWNSSALLGFALALTCGFVFLCTAALCFVSFSGQTLSLAGLAASVTGKADLRPASIPLMTHLARVLFGTVNNLVSVPELGATVQAWMRGQIPSLRPYSSLLPIAAMWLLGALLIAAIYLRTLGALLRRKLMLMPVAFLCGAQAWTIWYGLNDPEHWFQLSAPTILLFFLVMPAGVIRVVLPLWAVGATLANAALLAIPMATYPLARNEAELTQRLGPGDLLVLFVSYPGRPHAGFFNMPGVRTLAVDRELQQKEQPAEQTLKAIDQEIGRVLQAGGHVLVADILNPLDWEAPWMALLGQGVTKARVTSSLLDGRAALRLPDQGGIKLWDLRPKTAIGAASN